MLTISFHWNLIEINKQYLSVISETVSPFQPAKLIYAELNHVCGLLKSIFIHSLDLYDDHLKKAQGSLWRKLYHFKCQMQMIQQSFPYLKSNYICTVCFG